MLGTRRVVDSSERVPLGHPELGVRAALGQAHDVPEGARLGLPVLLEPSDDEEGPEAQRLRQPLLGTGGLDGFDQRVRTAEPPHRVPHAEHSRVLEPAVLLGHGLRGSPRLDRGQQHLRRHPGLQLHRGAKRIRAPGRLEGHADVREPRLFGGLEFLRMRFVVGADPAGVRLRLDRDRVGSQPEVAEGGLRGPALEFLPELGLGDRVPRPHPCDVLVEQDGVPHLLHDQAVVGFGRVLECPKLRRIELPRRLEKIVPLEARVQLPLRRGESPALRVRDPEALAHELLEDVFSEDGLLVLGECAAGTCLDLLEVGLRETVPLELLDRDPVHDRDRDGVPDLRRHRRDRNGGAGRGRPPEQSQREQED